MYIYYFWSDPWELVVIYVVIYVVISVVIYGKEPLSSRQEGWGPIFWMIDNFESVELCKILKSNKTH